MGREAKVKAATQRARASGSVTVAALDVGFPDLRRRTLRRMEKRINPQATRLPKVAFVVSARGR